MGPFSSDRPYATSKSGMGAASSTGKMSINKLRKNHNLASKDKQSVKSKKVIYPYKPLQVAPKNPRLVSAKNDMYNSSLGKSRFSKEMKVDKVSV